jgi:hypothetical protein
MIRGSIRWRKERVLGGVVVRGRGDIREESIISGEGFSIRRDISKDPPVGHHFVINAAPLEVPQSSTQGTNHKS